MNVLRESLQRTIVSKTQTNESRTLDHSSQMNASERASRFTFNMLLALLALTAFDILIKLAGFYCVYDTVKRWPIIGDECIDQALIDQICSAVDRAATYYPKPARCLQRSVVITCLLRRVGVPAELVIGARKMPFHGHAWVEVKGIVVNDNLKVQQFYSVLERC